jgi:hypothetical protein
MELWSASCIIRFTPRVRDHGTRQRVDVNSALTRKLPNPTGNQILVVHHAVSRFTDRCDFYAILIQYLCCFQYIYRLTQLCITSLQITYHILTQLQMLSSGHYVCVLTKSLQTAEVS